MAKSRKPGPAAELEADVTALNGFGDGSFRLGPRTVKIARTVPGDRIRSRVPEGEQRFVQGDLVRLLKPSPHRIDPGCAAFDQGCGGCQWLQMDYQFQLAWKTRLVREVLAERCPIAAPVLPTIGLEPPEAFRNKLSVRNVAGQACFMQDFSPQPLSPRDCRVATMALQAVWSRLRTRPVPADISQIHLRSCEGGTPGPDDRVGAHLFVTRWSPSVSEYARWLMVEAALSGVGASHRAEYRLLGGDECLIQTVAGLSFRIPHNGFFQTNHRQAARLMGLVSEALAPDRSQAVLDLYCGCGFFSLALARQAKTVLGIENNLASVATARLNAQDNGLSNCRFEAADVALALADQPSGAWPLVLVDPPRSGCAPEVLAGLLRLAPRRIVYVACSLDSLARDLKVLTRQHYRVSRCQPLDMFPHSFHCEVVARLERRG